MISKELKKSFVEKLIVEYKNYILFYNEAKKLKLEIIKSDEEMRTDKETKLEVVTKILNRLSDEMSFPTPSIWIEYKYLAYQATDKEIRNVRDFIEHCSPEGYICTRRYQYMKKFMDLENFPKEMDLKDIIDSSEMEKIESDILFMSGWIDNEYKINNNKISKW